MSSSQSLVGSPKRSYGHFDSDAHSSEFAPSAKRSRPLETTLPSIRLIPELNKSWSPLDGGRKLAHSHHHHPHTASLASPQPPLTCITSFPASNYGKNGGCQTGLHSPQSAASDGASPAKQSPPFIYNKPNHQQQQQHERSYSSAGYNNNTFNGEHNNGYHHHRSYTPNHQHHQHAHYSSVHSRHQQHPGAALTPPLSTPKTSSDHSPANNTTDTSRIARNWSREETLSLVRAIGKNYAKLRQCKTNQERSSVWRQVHHEHSSRFPGRSKKASQDRWGKVLSDYKDVVIHNKEKGAARWTFDFFDDVAAILRGDTSEESAATLHPHPSDEDLSITTHGPYGHNLLHPHQHPHHYPSSPGTPELLSSTSSPVPNHKNTGKSSSTADVPSPLVSAESLQSTTTTTTTEPANAVGGGAPPSGSAEQGHSQHPGYLIDLLRRQLSKMDAQIRSMDLLRQNTLDVLRHVENSLPAQQQAATAATATTSTPTTNSATGYHHS
ncbi:hypothetical protein H4219_002232 [Mycoemilia scoparia]|uniref:Myb-like domain-containing protein n=1 Tax=Mycoemilia scoparia TaxID=417184 RepID=A0A9W8A4N6_9FUNG|nr:hypothetical protein H4219_002232 [Mycoemilia scoparia]